MTIRGVVEDDVYATLGSLADEEAGIAEIETANGHVDTDFSMVFPFDILECVGVTYQWSGPVRPPLMKGV